MDTETDLINLLTAIRGHSTRNALKRIGWMNGVAVNEVENAHDRRRHGYLDQTAQYVEADEWSKAEHVALALGRFLMDVISDDSLHRIAEIGKTEPTKAIEKLSYRPGFFTASTYIGTIVRQHHVCNFSMAVGRLRSAIHKITNPYNSDILRLNQIEDYYMPKYRKLKATRLGFYLADGCDFKPVTSEAVDSIVKDVLKAKHEDPVKLTPLIHWQHERLTADAR